MRSRRYKNWLATLDLKTCLPCRKNHGKVYHYSEIPSPKPPLHLRCRCVITWLQARYAGTATARGENGADFWLKQYGRLPEYYISEIDAKRLGYKSYLGNFSIVAPRKMLTKGIFKNRDEHLPAAQGRIWYEADINYILGFRTPCRILYSNDRLIFVTYDHYITFQEIV